jgi:hypothetical protein
MANETLSPKDKTERPAAAAGRMVLEEIGAQALDGMATVTGSLMFLTGRPFLARWTRELLKTADELHNESRRMFP